MILARSICSQLSAETVNSSPEGLHDCQVCRAQPVIHPAQHGSLNPNCKSRHRGLTCHPGVISFNPTHFNGAVMCTSEDAGPEKHQCTCLAMRLSSGRQRQTCPARWKRVQQRPGGRCSSCLQSDLHRTDAAVPHGLCLLLPAGCHLQLLLQPATVTAVSACTAVYCCNPLQSVRRQQHLDSILTSACHNISPQTSIMQCCISPRGDSLTVVNIDIRL